MPYYAKSEDWLKQSSLLIEARPATTKVTTTYTVKPARKEKEDDNSSKPAAATTPTTKKSYGHLVLKTYDPISGACLKYRTSKAAEVSRLIQMLGTLGKKMAGVPESAAPAAGAGQDIKDEVMTDAPPVGVVGNIEAERASGASTPAPGTANVPAQGGGGGGGKGKKKKGKR
ncbi:Signal recognition particle 9 kDa protein (SRP9) domain containing protein [Naviculisporaceae sp. PSN 640]